MSTGQPFRKPFLANSDLLLGTEIVSPPPELQRKGIGQKDFTVSVWREKWSSIIIRLSN